ncbi:hypothetical protein BJ875DRAFT_444153 [Amylocarpus encephaloides]|uniref:Uncharacterized protein n=1 Tax=Amylocarpus encephaloides TaxID=45428 RepID=A0A9P8C2U8_9HELO|nr:hypothetical protein BJ875DRAFT_444153 [Amylocarpus encephaloides]
MTKITHFSICVCTKVELAFEHTNTLRGQRQKYYRSYSNSRQLQPIASNHHLIANTSSTCTSQTKEQSIIRKFQDPHIVARNQQSPTPRPKTALERRKRKRKEREATTEMILTKTEAITGAVAEAARASLDKEIDRKKAEGKLDAGQRTLEILTWTTETLKAAKDFESSIDLPSFETLEVTPTPSNTKDNIKWVGPIVYGDVLPKPLRYQSSAQGYGIIGILALGSLQLPEVGNSGSKQIQSGSVAYFRDASPVVYRSCGGGRGILFCISI